LVSLVTRHGTPAVKTGSAARSLNRRSAVRLPAMDAASVLHAGDSGLMPVRGAPTILAKSNETVPVKVDPQALSADSFTESDLARIDLVSEAESRATRLGEYAQMVGEDLAQAGDYVRQAARICASVQDSFLAAAVIAERVRGTSWEIIADVLRTDAADVQERWEGREERWRHASRVDSLLRKDPRYYVTKADRYITTDAPYQFGTATRRPLSDSLDAAAHLTGRDVAAADRAFAGTACTHCSH
jgi:hypothetical protein